MKVRSLDIVVRNLKINKNSLLSNGLCKVNYHTIFKRLYKIKKVVLVILFSKLVSNFPQV